MSRKTVNTPLIRNRMIRFWLLMASTLALINCGGSGSSVTPPVTQPPPVTPPSPPTTNPPTSLGADAELLGIQAVPESAPQAFRDNYVKFTSLTAPNGGAISIYAQDQISNEQMARARNILAFYLENLPLSVYGTNKMLVANQMANNNATLIMLNGSDNDNAPTDGQTLYQTENIIEGSEAYLSNEPRDAALEEILHLVHDTGIGVDGNVNTLPGVDGLRPFQREIRTAMENAVSPGVNSVSSQAAQLNLWGGDELDFLNELSAENSLTQEYLAAVIDVYYGLQGAINGNDDDMYRPRTRAEIEQMDPMAWAIVGNDNPRRFFSEFLTYTARIDSSFDGTFTLSFDEGQTYTYKSQYLINAQLTGTNNANLTGNDQNNRLGSNAGMNILDGGAGEDTAVFIGNFSEYRIDLVGSQVVVTDTAENRNGVTEVRDIETLEFADRLAFINEDGQVESEEDPFLSANNLTITAQELVDNSASGGDISLQLNFLGDIVLPDGTRRAWTPEERQPYVAGANRWLEVLSRAGNVDNYALEIKILVDNLTGANGVASPFFTRMVVDGTNVFPSQGMFVVNNCLYVEVSSDTCPNALSGQDRIAEFDANVRHEIGHILGIGSLWNLDASDNHLNYFPALEGTGDFRNWVGTSEVHQGLIYRQPHGVEAYNRFTASRFDFAPVSLGHLYSDDQNSPEGSARRFNGTLITSLDTELMASDNNYTPVLFGFLQDLGWVIGQNPRPNEP